MSLVHTVSVGLRSAAADASSANSISTSYIEIGTSEVSVDVQLGASITNFDEAIAVTAANIQSLELVSDRDCVVKTNSTGSPSNTFNLKGGYPLIWSASSGYFTNPISANITHLYITTTLPTRFQARFLVS